MRLRAALRSITVLLPAICPAANSADSSFLLTADRLAPYTRSYLGNGYFSLVTSPLGTPAAHSFMIKVYDRAPEDVPRMALLPAWNEVNLFNGRAWLNEAPLDERVVRSFRQTLNLYDGWLDTAYQWVDGPKAIGVSVEAFVSRADPHLAAVRFRVTPQFTGPLKVALPIRPWPAPARQPVARMEKLAPDAQGKRPDVRYPGHMRVAGGEIETGAGGGLLKLIAQPEGNPLRVAEAVALSWPAGLPRLQVQSVLRDDQVGVELSFEGQAGVEYSFVKYAGIVPSFAAPDPARRAEQTARSARARGYDSIAQEHAAAWRRIWETDILVEDNPLLQKVIHSTIFYLLASVREGTEFNIPPMGLSSSGYVGHIFWDSDTFMYPALLLLHPEAARSLVMFRCNTLDAAKENARLNGYQGAMYPWEADETGYETTPRFAWQNALSENHVTAAVALGVWQYYLATADLQWLARHGYPVLRETADYWVSRVTFHREKDRYEIRNVVSPDEGSVGVNNDVVTNVGARRNLEIAVRASQLLGRPANPEWGRVIEKIYIPYEAREQYYPEFEGAPAWKGGVGHVTPLMNFPYEFPVTAEAKRNTLQNALKSITSTGGGAFLLPTIYPMVAAELGDQAMIDDCHRRSYVPYLKPPFQVLNEGTRGESVNFLTGAGLLQQFLFAYTGLRLTEEGLTPKFKPVLPSGIRKLALQNIRFRGAKYDFQVENNQLQVTRK